jgi:hypothetical protein
MRPVVGAAIAMVAVAAAVLFGGGEGANGPCALPPFEPLGSHTSTVAYVAASEPVSLGIFLPDVALEVAIRELRVLGAPAEMEVVGLGWTRQQDGEPAIGSHHGWPEVHLRELDSLVLIPSDDPAPYVVVVLSATSRGSRSTDGVLV